MTGFAIPPCEEERMRVNRGRPGALGIAAVTIVLSLACAPWGPAGAAALGQPASDVGLPPRVKASTASGAPATVNGVFDRRLRRGLVGFCGGDDWEPEIASTPDGHVYVVWAHFPGDPTCDPASANPNRIYIRVSDDGGATFGPAHVVANA